MARIRKSSMDSYTAYAKGGGKVPKTPAQKKFAALAPPKNKITFADRIAGAKKRVKKAQAGKTLPKKSDFVITESGDTLRGKQAADQRAREKYMIGTLEYLQKKNAPAAKPATKPAPAPKKRKGGSVKKSTSKMKMMRKGGSMKKCRGGCY